ncbi:MAG: hypothetical protein AB8B79_18370 [Granulosicoccus sp.]
MSSALSWLSMRPSKGVAFAIHLTLSLLIFSTLVFMMALYWFPGELFFIDGGWQGLKLVAMVDLVLGPALTLLLYKPGKPKLVLDMSLIAAFQIAALGFGFFATYQQRTVAIVFSEKTFSTLSAQANKEADQELLALNVQPKPLPETSLLKLPLLLTPEPENYGVYLEEIFNGYPGPNERSDQFVPLAAHRESMRKHALTPAEVENAGASEAIDQALAKLSLATDNVELYKFKARYDNGIAIFDPRELRILDFVTYDSKAQPEAELEVADGEAQ